MYTNCFFFSSIITKTDEVAKDRMLECQEYLELRQQQCIERMCMKPSQATISDLDFMLWYKEALQDQEVCDNSSATCPKDVSSRLASNEEIQDFLHKDHLLDEKINFQLTLLNRKLTRMNEITTKATSILWTTKENENLRRAISEHGGNWEKISLKAFGGLRTGVQIRQHWHTVLAPGLKKRRFTDSEDKIVLDLVTNAGGIFGNVEWKIVLDMATQLSGRTTKQIRERYNNHLDPTLNLGEWTVQENALLIRLQKRNENKWSMFAKELTGRTANAIKNRWNSHVNPAKKATRSYKKRKKATSKKKSSKKSKIKQGE